MSWRTGIISIPQWGWQAAVGLVGLVSCHAPSAETKTPTATAVAYEARTPDSTSTTSISPPPPALPDSLALTPVAPLLGLSDSLHQAMQQLHSRLGADATELRPEVLERACVGYLTLRHARRIQHSGVLAVADMDLPSNVPRLWVLDLRAGRVLHRSHVAHGQGSGTFRARQFSNRVKSACTALGFYRTEGTYGGKHGLSRRLRGLDKDQNDNALRRYVVLHAADYASQDYLQRHGQLGYSRGCPALPPDQYRAIIRSLPEGSCLVLLGPGLESKWLDGAVAARQLAARGWR